MNKRYLILISVLLVGVALALLLRWNNARQVYLPAVTDKDKARAAVQANHKTPVEPKVVAQPPLAPSHAVRLAIGWLGLPDEAQNRQVGDLVVAGLSGFKGLELVERQALDTVLREQEFNLSSLVRAKDAVRVGKLLRAEWFLLGTCGTAGASNQTIVARIVDARTGIIRDVGVFTAAQGVPALAQALADFVKQCRQGISLAKPRTFLAVGTFADVGINRRQAEFAQQLRAYLTQAYQSSQVTLLEREQVSTLLQEVRLDLAGLSEDSGTNTPQPMQSTFWLVNGFYQSFETTGHEVELVLRVNRAFGRTTNVLFRGQPGMVFLGKIKDTIDTTLATAGPTILAPTRRGELHQQLEMGQDLLTSATGNIDVAFNPSFTGRRQLPEEDLTKRRGYLSEAMRAFETALLLEPDSREARYFLSACLWDEAMGRQEEGLGYLRELANSPSEDYWSERARVALAWLHSRSDKRESARWFIEAANRTTNAGAAANYRRLARDLSEDAAEDKHALQGGANADARDQAMLEERLFEGLRGAQDVFKGKSGVLGCSYPIEHFVEAYGTNREAAATRLVELLPRLIQRFPELAPHLLCCVASFQVDTNAPVITEFRKSLAACAENPETVLGCDTYFQNLLYYPYDWCMGHKFYALAAELVEAKRHASVRRPQINLDERDKVRLAFAYLGPQRWREALPVLENLGDVSIVMQADGPWGAAWTPVVPARLAANCRQRLGLPQIVRGGHFTIDRPCLCLHTRSAFAASAEGLWIATGGQLIQVSFDLRTNKVVKLPVYAEITSLCLGPGQVWVGTAGNGLVEYEKASGECRLITEKEGLMINYISSLCLQEKTLWIGFGRERAGGLGALNRSTGHLASFTPSLSLDPLGAGDSEAANGPPSHAVTGLMVGASGELWMLVTGRGLCRYRTEQHAWDTCSFDNRISPQCFGVVGDSLVGGFSDSALWRSRDGHWERLGEAVTLPEPPKVLYVDGSDLWLGGRGYIVAFDLGQNRIRASCSLAAKTMDYLRVAGGYLWAQFDGHLYRVPLSATR